MDAQIIAAVIGATGVVIGVLITSIITGISDAIKYNREEEIYYKRKKEEAYIKCINFITNIEFSENKTNCKGITHENIIQMLTELKLYASYNIYNKFEYLAHDIINQQSSINRDKIDEFITLLRNDLKIRG